jgi:plastocyanin
MRRIALLLFVALASCGDGNLSGPGGPGAGANEVRVGNNFFNPSSRTVSVGTTITWTWNNGAVLHNVTFGDGPASPNQTRGTYQRTFNAAGSFPYSCTIHGGAMSGTITVN